MGSIGVVLDPPVLDDPPGLGDGDEPVLVEAFVVEPPVEALDVGILDRFAGPDELEPHAVLVRPNVQSLASELGSVVDDVRLRQDSGTQKMEWRITATPQGSPTDSMIALRAYNDGVVAYNDGDFDLALQAE